MSDCYRASALGILLLAITISGCERTGPPRVVVAGTVTYEGDPVVNGQIRFTPSKGSTGPTSIAVISNGAYRADHRGGVPVATQRVEILAYRPDPGYQNQTKNVPPMFTPEEWPPKLQYLPEKYGAKSELEMVVQAGRGEIHKNFDLIK